MATNCAKYRRDKPSSFQVLIINHITSLSDTKSRPIDIAVFSKSKHLQTISTATTQYDRKHQSI